MFFLDGVVVAVEIDIIVFVLIRVLNELDIDLFVLLELVRQFIQDRSEGQPVIRSICNHFLNNVDQPLGIVFLAISNQLVDFISFDRARRVVVNLI